MYSIHGHPIIQHKQKYIKLHSKARNRSPMYTFCEIIHIDNQSLSQPQPPTSHSPTLPIPHQCQCTPPPPSLLFTVAQVHNTQTPFRLLQTLTTTGIEVQTGRPSRAGTPSGDPICGEQLRGRGEPLSGRRADRHWTKYITAPHSHLPIRDQVRHGTWGV